MLNIGNVITLEVISGKKEMLRCKLHDRIEGGLLVDFPTSEETGKTVFLHNGTELLATFINNQDEVYRFKTIVKGKLKNNIPMLILQEPKEMKKVQRRQFVRIETTNDVAVHPLNDEFDAFTTITDNISGGGTAIYLPENTHLIQGIDVKLWLVLPFQNGTIEYLQIIANVVRIEERKNDKQLASLKFEKLDDISQQKLMRFCFETQLQQKKRGLIE